MIESLSFLAGVCVGALGATGITICIYSYYNSKFCNETLEKLEELKKLV